jgi:hypothetical protein
MSASVPRPSRRLLRAAAAERDDLTRHRARLGREREATLAELRRLDDALRAVDRRLAVLGELTGPEEGAVAPFDAAAPADAVAPADAAPISDARAPSERGAPAEGPGRQPARHVIRGPAIREAAVQVLISQPEHLDAVHYRRWYELVEDAGYEVAGKDPVAVFLTQVTRSPVVRKSTEPGVYEVDRQAPLRIRQRLERLQAELREVTVSPQAPVDLATVRARRHELDLAISQQERALEEALRVLRRDGPAFAAPA